MGAIGLLFCGALVVVAIMLWRSPTQLARTVTRPLDERLQELTAAVRAGAASDAGQDQRLDAHERRLDEHQQLLEQHQRLLAGRVEVL
ncbi:hypothetical protein [Nannocystis exedens]|uniref:hypothetical protein n=1 Tax=Nannocystis exedens TaxID=54 RepID=UPI0014731475|nr:hypothetical protein [Nannocystis exedens]